MDGSLRLGFFWLAAVATVLVAPVGARAGHVFTNEELFPRGHAHFSRCWRLERDYYALRAVIAQVGGGLAEPVNWSGGGKRCATSGGILLMGW